MNQNKYNAFITDTLPEKVVVLLDAVMELEGEDTRVSVIFGTVARKKIKVEVEDTYTRSLYLKLSWDDKTDYILVFCPLNKSPHEILYNLQSITSSVVNDSYTNEELLKLKKEAAADLGKRLQGGKLKRI